jgi:hypothetical protein
VDEQTPHHEDEIYFVVTGSDHRLVDIAEDLEALVSFAPPDRGSGNLVPLQYRGRPVCML